MIQILTPVISAMMTATDDAIASIVKILKKTGMYDNTVIAFTSDVSKTITIADHSAFDVPKLKEHCSINILAKKLELWELTQRLFLVTVSIFNRLHETVTDTRDHNVSGIQ